MVFSFNVCSTNTVETKPGSYFCSIVSSSYLLYNQLFIRLGEYPLSLTSFHLFLCNALVPILFHIPSATIITFPPLLLPSYNKLPFIQHLWVRRFLFFAVKFCMLNTILPFLVRIYVAYIYLSLTVLFEKRSDL